MKHGTTKAFLSIPILLLCCFMFFLSNGTGHAGATNKEYYHLVLLGDPHLPGKNIKGKERVIQTINSWDDVDMVIALGDICEDRGRNEEYAAAKKFFEKLSKPFYPVAGNHDILYEDRLSLAGKRKKADAVSREAKLKIFRETFGLEKVFYSKRAGNYLLVFLSIDHLRSKNLAELSDHELTWLRSELRKNNKQPTILFFHAPLKGTLRNYNDHANTPDFIAQPAGKIHDILMSNPQVFLWVAGHMHTSPKEESFASAINVYEKHVTNIHATDMNRETIWTNSLFLYPDRVLIKIYDHKKGAWLPELQRTIAPPAL